MTYWMTQLLNGLSFGMMLYMLAAGLTMTLGVMRLVNLTHGSFYLISAYVAMEVVQRVGNFAIAVVVAMLSVAVLGLITYPLLRAVGSDHLKQALLTFGLLYVIADLALMQWGGSSQIGGRPDFASGAIDLLGLTYPRYRLLLIVVGVVVVVVVELLQRRTMFGALIRAVVDDREMAGGVGRNASVLGLFTFLFGAMLAGLGGGLGGSMLGAAPGVDVEVLLFALIIVIIGGMGSTVGALVGALAVGVLDTIGRAVFPEVGAALIFLLMLLTLVAKPTGLFGREA